MAVADGASFFSRFTMKFVEVIGAGIATAVTGYLIAHLGGFWSAPARTPEVTPAAVQMAPAVSAVPKSARASPPPSAVEASAPAAAKPDAAKPDVAKPDAVAEKEPAAVGTPPGRPATPVRKSSASEPKATEPKPREAKATETKATESKSHEAKATEPKPRERDDTASVEEQVRAALAKVDANRHPLPEPAMPVESPPAIPSVAVVQPPSAAAPVAPAIAAVPAAPPAVVAVPPPAVLPSALSAAPVASAPAAVAPPLVGTVEIKSEPVATVDAAPPAATAPADDSKSKDHGFLATIEHIPDMLRPTAGATTAEPPRPPMPVGQ